jgi:Fur family transcriptional regulator, ferric uptake regulator
MNKAGAPADQLDIAMRLIRQRGGRCTRPRRVVLEALLDAGGQLRTAEELFAISRRSDPEITESTVYRTLTLLEDLGLASHVHLGHGPSHWYLKAARARWYLTCSACDAVIDTDAAVFDHLVDDIAARTGFKVDAGHFAVTGTCAACST